MFVVLKRKRKHALGFVDLHAIPEDDLKEHLKRRARREVGSGKLQREIDVLATTLAQARAEEDRLWHIQKQDESNIGKAKAWSVAFNNTKEITRHLEDLRTRRQQHLTSGHHFLHDLPPAISSATTNADGTFTLALPRDGRYGIVVRASRELEEGTPPYLWFVWVSLDGEPTKRVVLNNDNIVGAGSPESALT